MKTSQKMTDTVNAAKNNLESFINPEVDEYLPSFNKLDWLDPAIIILVLFGGISFGIACISALKAI